MSYLDSQRSSASDYMASLRSGRSTLPQAPQVLSGGALRSTGRGNCNSYDMAQQVVQLPASSNSLTTYAGRSASAGVTRIHCITVPMTLTHSITHLCSISRTLLSRESFTRTLTSPTHVKVSKAVRMQAIRGNQHQLIRIAVRS